MHCLIIRAHDSLFVGTGKLYTETRDFTVCAKITVTDLTLTADLGQDDHFNLARQGNVHLAMKVAEPLPETISVVAYAEFENVIEVDIGSNVT